MLAEIDAALGFLDGGGLSGDCGLIDMQMDNSVI